MLTLSIYLRRTEFEFETYFEFKTEFEIFCEYQPWTVPLSNSNTWVVTIVSGS